MIKPTGTKCLLLPQVCRKSGIRSQRHQHLKSLRHFFQNLLMPLLIWLSLASTILVLAMPVYTLAQTPQPPNPAPQTSDVQAPGSFLNEAGKNINLPGYTTNAHPNASFQSGASNITSAILYAVDFVKYLMGTIAVIVIIISGIRLITSAKQVDEISGKQKENLKYAIIGLILIIAADQFVKQVFYGDQGEVYSSGAQLQDAAKRGSDQIKAIYSLLEYISAALAVLMIVIGGVRLVTSGGNEEVQGKVKKQVTYAVAGLILMGISEFVIKDVIFPKQGSVLSDTEKAKHLIVNFTNFVSGFVSIAAVIMFIYGGYLYVTSFGNEDGTGKAKKIFTGAIIGLLLAMAAFGIISTVVKFKPTSGIESAGTNAANNLPTSGNIVP